MVLHILVLFLWFLSPVTSEAHPNCKRKCGKVDVPYPFGIGEPGCARNDGFDLTCNHTYNPPRLLWKDLIIEDISLLQGEMTVSTWVSYDCYNQERKKFSNWIEFQGDDPYTISNTRNQFTAIGCDTLAAMLVYKGDSPSSAIGCISTCFDETSAIDGSCIGMGCCQFKIPAAVKKFDVTLGSFDNHTSVWDFNNCSYSFLGDPNRFNFSVSYLRNFTPESVLTVLDWVVGTETCEAALKKDNYACGSENTFCYNSTNGPGYRCNCSEGYEGNPYLNGTAGCGDIDECDDKDRFPCQGICRNTPGSYECICPKGTRRTEGMDCVKEFPKLPVSVGNSLRRKMGNATIPGICTWVEPTFKKFNLIIGSNTHGSIYMSNIIQINNKHTIGLRKS